MVHCPDGYLPCRLAAVSVTILSGPSIRHGVNERERERDRMRERDQA